LEMFQPMGGGAGRSGGVMRKGVSREIGIWVKCRRYSRNSRNFSVTSRQRSTVEPIIGHAKVEHRMGRDPGGNARRRRQRCSRRRRPQLPAGCSHGWPSCGAPSSSPRASPRRAPNCSQSATPELLANDDCFAVDYPVIFGRSNGPSPPGFRSTHFPNLLIELCYSPLWYRRYIRGGTSFRSFPPACHR
jgi:hypothetical protein